MPDLGVNIDHVATVRQARMTDEPDPVWAASCAELAGADCITIHLREDRRHIQDRDFLILRETTRVKLNLEMACDDQILNLACEQPPDQVTLVPERREELTTEGGLDVCKNERVTKAVQRLQDTGIPVSLFLDPSLPQIERAMELKVNAVELHTGAFADATPEKKDRELQQLITAAEQINHAGILVYAGHGLTYTNVRPIASIPDMRELNIGHSIIARSILVGLREAVREMKQILIECDSGR